MRKNYYLKKFKCIKNDQKVTWKNINMILNRKKRQTVNEVINDDGEKLSGNNMVAYFNDYYCNIASKLIERLPQTNNHNVFNTISRNPASCVFYPTNEVEVSYLLKDMKDKGSSLYCIKPGILLSVSNIIIPLLVHLFNICMF